MKDLPLSDPKSPVPLPPTKLITLGVTENLLWCEDHIRAATAAGDDSNRGPAKIHTDTKRAQWAESCNYSMSPLDASRLHVFPRHNYVKTSCAKMTSSSVRKQLFYYYPLILKLGVALTGLFIRDTQQCDCDIEIRLFGWITSLPCTLPGRFIVPSSP